MKENIEAQGGRSKEGHGEHEQGVRGQNAARARALRAAFGERMKRTVAHHVFESLALDSEDVFFGYDDVVHGE